MRLWLRLPVLVRATLAGVVVLVAGTFFNGPLLYANLAFRPDIPWSVPLIAVYLWFFWQYAGGRWWPKSTSEARRGSLRANPLSRRVWLWALVAGYLAMASNFALHWAVGRVAPLRFAVPEVLAPLPLVTLFAIFLVLSAAAGIVEEAAFRGYMQGPIERRYGILVSIAVVSVIFGALHLTDWQPQMTAARMFFIVLASVLYGIMVWLTDSILPGVILHATGDAIGITWIWWLGKQRRPDSDLTLAAAMSDAKFWTYTLEALVLGALAVWAFRKLALVVRSEREVVT